MLRTTRTKNQKGKKIGESPFFYYYKQSMVRILMNDYRYEVLKTMRPFFRDIRIMDLKKYDDEHYLFQIEHIYKPMQLILDVTDSQILFSSFFGSSIDEYRQ